MKLKSFDDLFNILLSDCAIIEEQNLKFLPKLIEKCTSPELRSALEKHFNEAKEHSKKVQKIFQQAGLKPTKIKWESPIKDVFKNAIKFIDENEPSPILDAAIIAMVQQLEHFEIAHYGALREYATITEKHELADLLRSTLKEEKLTDSVMIRLARESGLNVAALHAHI